MGGSFWTILAQFGMAGIIFGGFLFVLKWVFDINKSILMEMAEERKGNREMLKGFAENIKENSQSSRDFHKAVDEAHKYQRDEHQQMILSLGRINGYKEN